MSLQVGCGFQIIFQLSTSKHEEHEGQICDISWTWWLHSCWNLCCRSLKWYKIRLMEEIRLTSWYGKCHIICRVSYMSGVSGFLPSVLHSLSLSIILVLTSETIYTKQLAFLIFQPTKNTRHIISIISTKNNHRFHKTTSKGLKIHTAFFSPFLSGFGNSFLSFLPEVEMNLQVGFNWKSRMKPRRTPRIARRDRVFV